MHKNGNNANIGSRRLYYVKTKKSSEQCYPCGNRTEASHNHWFQVQHSPFWTKLTFACKTETLSSLYSHALLIPTRLSKFKNQVVHELKFKDLSSTWQVSVERRVLDLESEVMRGLGSIPAWGNIFHWNFLFSHNQASDANIGIIANFCLITNVRKNSIGKRVRA